MVVFNISCEETRVVACRLSRKMDELLQLTHIRIVFGCCHAFDGFGTIQNGRHDFFGMADLWIYDVLVL